MNIEQNMENLVKERKSEREGNHYSAAIFTLPATPLASSTSHCPT